MPHDDDAIAARIAAALPEARWFADKGAKIDRVTVHDRVAVPPLPGSNGEDVSLVLADVHAAAATASHRYCLPVDAAGHDAAGTPAFVRWLLGAVLSGARHPAGCGAVVGHGCDRPAGARDVTAAPVVVPIGGDASNSSFVVQTGATGFVVKLFRRCRAGIQPEVEVGAFLAAHGGTLGVPRLRGWLEYAATDGSSTAIATVHDLVPDCTTAWERLVGLLTSGGMDAVKEGTTLTIVAAIGKATGQMHRALASRPDIPAFAPELPTAAGRRAAAERMADHAAAVFALIESRLPHLPPAIAVRLRRLLAERDALLGRFASLGTLAMTVPNIRVHGDYHLGQVLVAARDDRVLVIDFEGEPGRSLDERRAKASAAKDVAGMCRSFDYLVRHVASVTGGTYRADDARRLEDCFLDAYRGVAAGEPWWPADESVAAALLDVHRLDKAIYELAYEITNRPDWIAVPLAALEDAVATSAPSRA